MLYGLLIILAGAIVAYLGHHYSPPPLNVVLIAVGVIMVLFGAYYAITSVATDTAGEDYDSMRMLVTYAVQR